MPFEPNGNWEIEKWKCLYICISVNSQVEKNQKAMFKLSSIMCGLVTKINIRKFINLSYFSIKANGMQN